MRILPAVALAFALFTLPAVAQDDLAERKELALQLVQITTTDSVMGPMIDAVWPAVEAQLGPNPDAQLVTELKQVFTDEISGALVDVIDDIAAAYAGEFTKDELTEIVAFYQSDAGTKLISRQGALMAQMMPAITTRLQETLPGAMQRVMEAAQARTR